jgi:hypothetical protein
MPLWTLGDCLSWLLTACECQQEAAEEAGRTRLAILMMFLSWIVLMHTLIVSVYTAVVPVVCLCQSCLLFV